MLKANPLLQWEWVDNEDGPIGVLFESETGERFPVTDPAYLFTISIALEERDPAELRDRLVEDVDVDRSRAERVVLELREQELLVSHDDDRFDRVRQWFERDWRLAFYCHLAARRQMAPNGFSGTFKSVATVKTTSPVSDRPSISLPSPAPLGDESLESVMLERHTSRAFCGQIDRDTVSTLLYHTFSPERQRTENDGSSLVSAPFAAAATYPFSVYPVILNASDLSKGVYRYLPSDHSLERIRSGVSTDLVETLAIGQSWVSQAPVTFLFTADMAGTQQYHSHPQAFRSLFTNLAATAHRLILTATTLGLKNFLSPAIRDDEVEELLEIEPLQEAVLYLVSVGR